MYQQFPKANHRLSLFAQQILKLLCNCKIFKNTLEYLQKYLADTKELLIFASSNYKNK